jgi:VWFA-related protein
VRYSSIRALVVSGVLASGLAALAAAQAPPQPPAPAQPEKPQDPAPQPPRFRADASFVRVDAYPLKDGKPVLDLKQEDFEVFEDGVLQKVESFEHVVVQAAGPQNDVREVSSQRESLQAAANPRNRVFVIFLDTPHVAVESAHAINEPLIRLMDRILGPDDLVGVMTPEMAASQIVLARKTQVVEESLRRNWAWGRRFSLQKDEREEAYSSCYPPLTTEPGGSALARELIGRKRERATLEALQDLVRYLRTIREERKAILTVTEGWLLYGQNQSLMNLRKDPMTGSQEQIPGVDPITVGPNGKLTTHDPRNRSVGALSKTECDADRMQLAMMDNQKFFRDLMDEANAGNSSFYPVDPRGLAVFDNPLGPEAPPPINVDMAMLKQRVEVLRTLASNTDGIAVVNSNDLDRGMRRISDDLTSYYLLGYNSTNPKLDGRFRALKVKVKKPGVEVRARRGYKAATEAEVTAARRAADAPIPDATRAVNAAIDRLGRLRPDTRFLIHAVTSAGAKPTLWVAGELQTQGGRPDDFARGGTADIEATVGSSSASTKVTLKPGERTFLATMPVPAGAAGEVTIRARLRATEGSSMPLSDTLRIERAATGPQPLLFRRGATTGNRIVPAADLRFSRTERVRLELPVEGEAKPGSGRLLDRTGQPLQVPVVVGERLDDATGQRWITADLALAALSGGDYAIEVEIVGTGKSQRIVSAIRVVR